jgi:MFS family permease
MLVSKSIEYKTKAMLWGSEFINGIRRDLVAALILIYFIFLGHDILAVTTLFAASKLVFLFFEFPTGAFADQHSRKKSVIISFTLMTLSFLGIFTFQNFWYLAFFYILGDIAWTFQSGTTTAWAVDNLKYGKEKKKLASLFARLHLFERSGSIIGGIIGLMIVAINFHFVWLFIAIVNLVWVIIISLMTDEKNFKPKKANKHFIINTYVQAKESLKYLVHKKNKQLKGLAISVFVGTAAFDAFFILIPLIFVQNLNVSINKIPLIFSLVAVGALVSTFIGEKSAHSWGFRKSLLIGYLGAGIAIIVFAISKSIILSIASLAVMHIFETAYACVVYDSAIQHAISSKSRATLGSAMSIIWSLGNAMGVGLAGLGIKFIGLVNTTLICGIVAIIAGFLFYFNMEH